MHIEEPCGRNGFACSSGSPPCINKELKYCNGYSDCSDDSDEMCTSDPQSDDGPDSASKCLGMSAPFLRTRRVGLSGTDIFQLVHFQARRTHCLHQVSRPRPLTARWITRA